MLSLIPVLIVFGVGQLISDLSVNPESWSATALACIRSRCLFAVLAGGHLFGFFGILLATAGGGGHRGAAAPCAG
jgi:hypothetical protein